MTAQQDPELRNWLINIENMRAGDFLRTLALAAQMADYANYAILRPALLELKDKYPEYNIGGVH